MYDRFEFAEPATIAVAQKRKRLLERDIAEIGRQLANPNKRGRGGKPMSVPEYAHWRVRTRNALVIKETEQVRLKDWIQHRRRELLAADLDIEDCDDPIDILVATRAELIRALEGDATRLGLTLSVIEQYLTHSA